MLISYKKKFIFIHIPKTAGTSVMDVFLPYARPIERMVYEYKITSRFFTAINYLMGWHDHGGKHYTGYHKHAKACDVKEKLGEEAYQAYYSFSFVRNPYDRLVSLYFYICQSGTHIDHKIVSEMEFNQFLDWYLPQDPPTQSAYIIDPLTGEVIVDYIGKVETLEMDVQEVRNKLELSPQKKLTYKKISSLRKQVDYREFYTTELVDLVRDYYQDDFLNLGYSQ